MARDAWSKLPYKRRQHIKQVLLARDGLTCCLCKRPMRLDEVTVEHRLARSLGGSVVDYANLGLAHAHCNYSRRYIAASARRLVVDGAGFFDREAGNRDRKSVV